MKWQQWEAFSYENIVSKHWHDNVYVLLLAIFVLRVIKMTNNKNEFAIIRSNMIAKIMS